MNWKQAILSVVISSILGVASIGQSSKEPAAEEQSLFGAEDDTVEKPVNLPTRVLQILAKDEHVAQYLKAQGQSPDELTTESFLASEIHLDGPHEIDLIATGIGRLRGNAAAFWVFQPHLEAIGSFS